MYRPTFITRRYGLTRREFEGWYKQYHTYLSASANPHDRGIRLLTIDDLKIFLLTQIYSFTESHEQICARLEKGERTEIPIDDFTSKDELLDKFERFDTENKELRDTAMRLRAENELLQDHRKYLEEQLAVAWRKIGRLTVLLPEEAAQIIDGKSTI